MSLIERAKHFFYFEDDLCEQLADWAKARCSTFTCPNSRSYEHPLEHTTLFNAYVLLFEDIFESFLRREGISSSDFYSEVQEELAHNKDLSFASIILGATEFHNFCDLMNDVREGNGVVFCPPLVLVDDSSQTKQYSDQQHPATRKAAKDYITGLTHSATSSHISSDIKCYKEDATEHRYDTEHRYYEDAFGSSRK